MDEQEINDSHINEHELIGFLDCEVEPDRATQIEQHLKGCGECRARLRILSSGAQAYEQFHEQVLKPAHSLPQEHWPDLRLRPAVPLRRNFFARPALWGAVGLAACVVLLVAYLQRMAAPPRMGELLARASDVTQSPNRRIRVSVAGQTWLRPALLSRGPGGVGMQHVEALFVHANYNWDDPLSARSFASWRSHLREKRDHVIYINESGRLKRLYRVQTETSDGTLHVASLTLRGQDLAAVDGAFEFDNHERVTMSDAGAESPPAPSSAPEAVSAANNKVNKVVEHPVTAADELRVFAALDQIGADVDEPLDVGPDSGNQHIVVSGMGMSGARQEQIRRALAQIPNTAVRFSSAQAPSANEPSTVRPNPVGVNANESLRHSLEQSAGGAQQLQAITDQAFDASNLLVARAHALAVLAQTFPPGVEARFAPADRETLTSLRRKHAVVIEQTALKLESALKPVFPPQPAGGDQYPETGLPAGASWQTGAAELFGRVRRLDRLVTDLLGANYPSGAAQEVLNRLPKDLDEVEALARRQARAE